MDIQDYWFKKEATLKEQLDKVKEEVDEVIVEIDKNNDEAIIEESLDVFLAAANLLNILQRDYPIDLLGKVTEKWERKLNEYKKEKYA